MIRRHSKLPMPLKPIHLRRRRWTLFFTIPFTAAMLATFAYSVFLLIVIDERLVKLIAGVGAFATFCIGGSLGKTVLDALYDLEPAVIVNSEGLDDVRGGTGLVFWHEIESVKLDMDEQQIRVKVAARAAPDRRALVSATRRLFTGADYSIDLHGLSYYPHGLKQALAEHQRKAARRRARNVARADL